MKDQKEYQNLLLGNLDNFKGIKPFETWKEIDTLHDEMIKGLSKLITARETDSKHLIIGEMFDHVDRFNLGLLFDQAGKLKIKKNLDFIGNFNI